MDLNAFPWPRTLGLSLHGCRAAAGGSQSAWIRFAVTFEVLFLFIYCLPLLRSGTRVPAYSSTSTKFSNMYRADTLQFSCGFILSWCMHATKYQNLDGLNADDVLRAMWQKSRALIQKNGSLAPFAFSIRFQRCMIRLGRIKTARSKSWNH